MFIASNSRNGNNVCITEVKVCNSLSSLLITLKRIESMELSQRCKRIYIILISIASLTIDVDSMLGMHKTPEYFQSFSRLLVHIFNVLKQQNKARTYKILTALILNLCI